MKLWILRLLVPLGGHKGFINRYGFVDDEVAQAIGLDSWLDDKRDFDPKQAKADLFKLYKKYEHSHSAERSNSPLSRNIDRLARLANLSEVDCRIVEFVILLHTETLLGDAANLLGNVSGNRLFRVLSTLLDIEEKEIREALSQHGILLRSSIVSIDRQSFLDDLKSKIEPLSYGFVDHLLSPNMKVDDLLEGIVNPAPPPELKLSDYRHIDRHLKVLCPFLKQARAADRRGVNILLYGVPGTGKTQLARVLSKELGYKLFEINDEDDEGRVADKEQRIKAYQAAQCFLAQSKSLILFDEVEDIFSHSLIFLSNIAPYKSSLNRFLETNPVPTFWIANRIEHVDNAFIRRFDMCMEVPVPPQSRRREIIQLASKNILDEAAAKRLADSEKLAPALITRAASVVKMAGREFNKAEKISATEMLINGTLEAQGHRTIKRHDPNRLPEIYDPVFVNADMNLMEIKEGLSLVRAGRLCLYGPPGTGKTAYARWLAEQLERPLIVKRASDLMDCYVGGSEKNIARAFRQAEQEEAILLIDEVDSFLYDRRGTIRSWEASLVNEMLLQMESFSGIFIAATNLMDELDPASLRRFNLKMKFDFLKPDQAWALFQRHCFELKFDPASQGFKKRISQFSQLTPGDFAVIVGQMRLRNIQSAEDFLVALQQECDLKEGQQQKIGFN